MDITAVFIAAYGFPGAHDFAVLNSLPGQGTWIKDEGIGMAATGNTSKGYPKTKKQNREQLARSYFFHDNSQKLSFLILNIGQYLHISSFIQQSTG
jgi:hypothetical protein